MKVLLVNPIVPRSELYKEWDMSDVKSESPPIGLLSIAAYVRECGHEVSFKTDDPAVVAITAMTIQIEYASKKAKLYKKMYPNCVTVLGGPHVTACPEETLRRHPEFDFGVIGEGEIVFSELLNALSHKRSVRHIQGLVFQDEGNVRINPRRAYIKDLDTLPPPAYDLIPGIVDGKLSSFGTKSKKSIGLVTSRGCPGMCTFCDRGVFGRAFRCHSAEYVLGMMVQFYIKNGVTDFLFFDDLFVANRQRLTAFCKIVKPWNFTWSCCARTDFIDKDMLPKMKASGCWMIEYGIESGNEKVLQTMKKNVTKERMHETIQATHEAGIQSKGNFIFGNFGETVESLRESIDFACELPLDYFQHTFMAPLPGSEAWDTASSYGEFIPDWGRCNTFQINFVPSGLSRKDLKRLSKEAWMRFYLRPKVLLREIKSMGWNKFRTAIKAFLKTVLR